MGGLRIVDRSRSLLIHGYLSWHGVLLYFFHVLLGAEQIAFSLLIDLGLLGCICEVVVDHCDVLVKFSLEGADLSGSIIFPHALLLGTGLIGCRQVGLRPSMLGLSWPFGLAGQEMLSRNFSLVDVTAEGVHSRGVHGPSFLVEHVFFGSQSLLVRCRVRHFCHSVPMVRDLLH